MSKNFWVIMPTENIDRDSPTASTTKTIAPASTHHTTSRPAQSKYSTITSEKMFTTAIHLIEGMLNMPH